MSNNSFYAHHSAFGAFSSFMLGKVGKGGGFVLNDVQPPDKNVFIGYKQDAVIKLLPFCKIGGRSASADFTGNLEIEADEGIEFFDNDSITRTLNWASDKWKAQNFEFSLITPFDYLDNPNNMTNMEKKLAFAPLIFAQISLDNTQRETQAELIFAVEEAKRLFSWSSNGKYLGGAEQRSCGYAAIASDEVREFSSHDFLKKWKDGNTQVHPLGMATSLIFKVPAGRKKIFTIALATYDEGIVTSGIESSFYYTSLFNSLDEVLEFGLSNMDYYLKLAEKRDKELDAQGINQDKKFLISHATHSYYASSQLMNTKENNLIWIVNEGQYVMINTFDLTVDLLFWELRFHPWTMENVLENFVSNYRYYDQAGISFTHDMGVFNSFTPRGTSSYELSGVSGCFGYMTYEELLNWILCASAYGIKTGNKSWVKENTKVFKECLASLVARDKNNDGIMDLDSSKCQGAYEITTYDSLDHSLQQSKNNVYIAMKTWGAYIVLVNIFKEVGDENRAFIAKEKSHLIKDTLLTKFNNENGYIPAVFDNVNTSCIIPAIEGLIYPYYIGDIESVSEKGEYGKLIKMLKTHIKTILKKGICIDETTGGIKLSSTTTNTWNSKVFLNQYIVTEILGLDYSKEESGWDRVHAIWQQVGCSDFAATDQVNSNNGNARGSRLYPRLVTNVLWIK